MLIVVADTGQLNYLVLIGASEILPKLFESVLVPQAVQNELRRRDTPEPVRTWATHPPAWLEVRPNPADDPALPPLHEGERAAIALARAVKADAILIDDRAGVAAAIKFGLETIGTLGLLYRAAQRGLIDLEAAFDRLKATNFRYPPEIMDALLTQHKLR